MITEDPPVPRTTRQAVIPTLRAATFPALLTLPALAIAHPGELAPADIPPENLAAEQAVLGAMLLEGRDTTRRSLALA